MTLYERLSLILEVDKDITDDILLTVLKSIVEEYEQGTVKQPTEADRVADWLDDEELTKAQEEARVWKTKRKLSYLEMFYSR